ncbi:hypothetical protein PMIN03_007839 [Paraphaeosphaeria minitans]|uniref:Uncharacterized protein n=1 Tax=Paraphaeosphaeria minitans TaxID=565426 RepID=A0A9P6GKC9_9PLEO|nr:hypothetical protein PMIN01_04565 [Paraphaeosphaeria minitans]
MDLGALTTAFVPGPGCNDTIYGKIYSTGTVRDKWHSLGQTDTRSCYPPAFTTAEAYYSPGTCPSAWSSACGNVESIGSMTETRVTCCPVGYICATPQTSSPWDTFSCSRLYTDPPKLIVPQEINGKTTYMETTLGGPIVAYANQIEVRFQKEDFETAASTMSTSGSRSETRSQTSAVPSRTSGIPETTSTGIGGGPGPGPGPGGENRTDSYHLTAGSWAGIAVAVAVISVGLIGLAVFLVRMRRKRGDDDLVDERWTEVDTTAEMANSTPVCEVGTREVGEVRGDVVIPVELDPNARVHQLE